MATLRILIFFILSGDFALSPTQGTIPITNPTTPTPTRPPPTTSGGSWCIANPTASQIALQVALDYACGYGGTDCSAIQPSGACFDPSTVRDHASYAFNGYYQKNPVPTSCAFGGAAQLVSTDPRNVCLAAINKPTCEACVPCHHSMNRTLSKECAVNIV